MAAMCMYYIFVFLTYFSSVFIFIVCRFWLHVVDLSIWMHDNHKYWKSVLTKYHTSTSSFTSIENSELELDESPESPPSSPLLPSEVVDRLTTMVHDVQRSFLSQRLTCGVDSSVLIGTVMYCNLSKCISIHNLLIYYCIILHIAFIPLNHYFYLVEYSNTIL